MDHFNRAIQLDPRYGLAYSGLADSYVLLPFYSRISPAEAYPAAKQAALKAVALAPDSAEAHTSLAYVKLYSDWDFRAPRKSSRQHCNAILIMPLGCNGARNIYRLSATLRTP